MKNGRVLTVCGWALVLACMRSRAGDGVGLENLLRDKGVITETERRALDLSRESDRAAHPTVRAGGRIMVDVAAYDSDQADFENATEVRRARLTTAGTLDEKWFYAAQYDFTYSGAAGIYDLYLGYAGLLPSTRWRVGQFMEYGSLEDSTSSLYLMFLERALPILAFEPAARRLGVGLDTHGEGWYAGTGLFGENTGVLEDEDEGIGASARLAWSPVHDAGRVVHAGLSGAARNPRGDTVHYSARPESHVTDARLLDTAAISNVNSIVSAGLEAACVFGRVSAQAEYLAVRVDRERYADEHYDGYYVCASWFLTGETRPYLPEWGVFGRIKPKRAVGAWEVAARFSTLDLDDHVHGGEADSVTAGLNWYATTRVRFMLNYVNVSATVVDGEINADVWQARAQMDF